MRRILASLAAMAAIVGGVALASHSAVAAPKPFVNAIGKPVPTLDWAHAPKGKLLPKGRPGGVSANVACGTCFYYAGGSQTTSSSGAQVQQDASKPTVAAGDYHSLSELEVASAASGSNQVVEVGWTVDSALNGDNDPHLFVYWWKNGVGQGYNGSGYVNATGCSPCAGGNLNTVSYFGVLINTVIQHLTTVQCGCSTAGWWVAFNGTWQGVFPDTLWTSPTFTSAGYHNVFGEVAVSDTQSCTDMGNGTLAAITPSAVGARFGNFGLLGVATTPSLSPLSISNSAKWNAVFSPSTSVRSMRWGGPGWC